MTQIKLFRPLVIPLLLLWFASACDADPTPRTAVSVQDGSWYFNGQIIHPGSPAEGLLMNVRMVNSIFEDRGPALFELTGHFDPDANTDAFIEKIPEYVDSGVNAFTISLQGGLPGFEGAVNTAFRPDGSLRESYLERAGRVIRAADQNGAAIILSLFYQRQHSHEQALAGRDSIRRAVENAVDWIGESGFTNVVLEISNEYRHGGFRNWIDGEWLMSEQGQVELIRLAQERNPDLLVSTSGMGDGRFHEYLARAADFLLVHFNTTSLDLYEERIRELEGYGKPIVCNEDDKLGAEGVAALALAVHHGSSWGYMGSLRNQYYPFEFLGTADDPEVYEMYRSVSTPGYRLDPDVHRVESITINYPHDGEIFRTGEPVMLNLSHLPAGDSEAAGVTVYANDERFAELGSGLRLRVSWQTDEPGTYYFHAVVRDEAGGELYRSAPVDIIVE